LVVTAAGKGIAQGSALSPWLLSVYLDHHLDGPWRAQSSDPLLRYVDDLLLLRRGGDADGDVAAYDDLRRRLAGPGMPLKGCAGTAIHDLTQGATVTWLGFHIALRGRQLILRLPTEQPSPWEAELSERLAQCHLEPDAPRRAVQVIRGIIDQAGPAYPHTDRRAFYKQIVGVAADLDFDELPPFTAIEERWEAANRRWLTCRKHVATTLLKGSRQ
jgi:hypothetical protein